MVDKGEFREDLLYRINTIHVEIPPLRNRREDIVPLAERFITRFCKQYDKAPISLTASACEKLTAHSWYGNIRELEHAIEKQSSSVMAIRYLPKCFNWYKKQKYSKPKLPHLRRWKKP